MNTEEKIKYFLINASLGEVLNYKKLGKVPVVESYEKNQWSYIVEVMILTIKSLKPSEKEGGSIIDYTRLDSELRLWMHYRHGLNKTLVSAIKRDYRHIKEKDESVYARVCVIVCANQDWDTIKKETIKTALYSTVDAETLLESIMLARILFLILSCESIDYSKLLEDLKSEAVSLSQIDLKDSNREGRVSNFLNEKSYKIEFERRRIDLINILNEVYSSSCFVILKDALEIIKCGETLVLDEREDYNFFLTGLRGVNSNSVLSSDIKDIAFLNSICDYLVKLRKGRIALRDLSVAETEEANVDVFDYESGTRFFHPLLNTSRVLHKEMRENYIISYIETRSGIYRFIKTNKN